MMKEGGVKKERGERKGEDGMEEEASPWHTQFTTSQTDSYL